MSNNAPTLIQTLTLKLGPTVQVECQMTAGGLEWTYTDTTVVTMCGTYPSSTEQAALQIGGIQDYGATDALADLLHTAADTPGTAIDFELVVGGAKFTGKVLPRRPAAGGEAPGPFDFTLTLPVQGTVTKADTTADPAPAKGKAKAAA